MDENCKTYRFEKNLLLFAAYIEFKDLDRFIEVLQKTKIKIKEVDK